MPNKDNKINELESSIIKLKSELAEEKNKNINLSNEISMLKQQMTQMQSQINNQNNIQIDNSNNSTGANYSNEALMKLTKEKDDLLEKIKRYPVILEKGEKLISIIFSSVNQNFNYSLICKNTDNIHKIEEQLYNQYPQLMETENYFSFKGKLLNRFQVFEKNSIKNGDTIILKQIDPNAILK